MIQFVRPYRLQLVAAAMALIMAAVITLSLPWLFRYLIDEPSLLSVDAFPISLSIMIVLGFSLASSFRFFMVSWLGERVMNDIRKHFFSHAMGLDVAFHDRHHSSQLIARMMSDTLLIERVVGTSVSLALRNGILVLGSLVLLMMTSLSLTLLVISMVLAIMPLVIVIARWHKKASRQSQDDITENNASAAESFSGIKLFIASQTQSQEISRFNHAAESAFKSAITRIQSRAILTALVLAASLSMVVAVFIIGRMWHLTPGVLFQFSLYALLLATGLGSLSEVYGDVVRARCAFDRIQEILDVPMEPKQDPMDESVTINTLSLHQVSFQYEAREVEALHRIDINFKRGCTYALIGPSGSGKSSLFSLLSGYYSPSKGNICINGRKIDLVTWSKRSSYVVHVPQQANVFSRSLRDNFTCVKPDITDDEIWKTLKDVSLSDWAKELPHGLDTVFVEQGSDLSGGQRQRLGLARALCLNAEVILLDEPTNALDPKQSELIYALMHQHFKHAIRIVIKHQLHHMQRYDAILMLQDGRLVDSGTHDELIHKNQDYQQQWLLQKKNEEIV